MSQILETEPRESPRPNIVSAVVFITGIVISLIGVGVMVVALNLYAGAGSHPSWNESMGSLLIAVAGFLVSVGGTELRVNARRRLPQA